MRKLKYLKIDLRRGSRFLIRIENPRGGCSRPCSRCVNVLPNNIKVEYTDVDGSIRRQFPSEIEAKPSGGCRRIHNS